MSQPLGRRVFLKGAAVALAGSTVAVPEPFDGGGEARGGQFTGRIKKAVKFQMVRENLSVLDKFKLLKDLGFDGVEIYLREKVDPKEVAKARDATGLPVHGVVGNGPSILKEAVELAKSYGADSVLTVAGRVDADNSYDRVYETTQAGIRKAIPHAEKHRIKVLVENVWNNFLLSPLEMARYIDELNSPWVGVYFDVGNVVRFGWPQQWIRILGKRIVKLDIKEYSRTKQRDEGLFKGFNVRIGEGDCDWPAVREALAEINFSGWATAELPGGDRRRLADVAQRMNRVLDL